MAGNETVLTLSLLVLDADGAVLAGLVAAPNPALPSANAVTISWKALPGVEVDAILYNMAGERIMSAGNGAAPDHLSFDLRAQPVSTGIYLVALTAKAPWGSVENRQLKLALVR